MLLELIRVASSASSWCTLVILHLGLEWGRRALNITRSVALEATKSIDAMDAMATLAMIEIVMTMMAMIVALALTTLTMMNSPLVALASLSVSDNASSSPKANPLPKLGTSSSAFLSSRTRSLLDLRSNGNR